MANKLRQKTLQTGDVNTSKIGLPPIWFDFYYSVMAISWPRFIAYVTLVFVVLNLIFGAIFALIGGVNNLKQHSLSDGFFFSVETLATVGYGFMAPISPLAHFVATIEILIGLFFSAAITGIIFARLARPRASVAFAKSAVVDYYDGKRALMIRLASTRLHPLADMVAQVSWIERVKMHDGREFGQVAQLPLLRADFARLDLSWTLIHFIEEGGEFAKALCGDRDYRVFASVSGHDTLLGNQTHGSQAFNSINIHVNHKYVDMISFTEQTRAIDLSKLDLTEPHETSARE